MTGRQPRQPAGAPTGGQFAVTGRGEADVTLSGPVETPDWREQPVTVEGRRFTFADVYGGRLFHGSPHPIADGETIEPGRAQANFAQSDSDAVSITSGADTALYWARQAARGKPFYVYEVEPVGQIGVWRSGLANRGREWRLAEGRAPAARVLRRVDPDDAQHYESALMRGEDPLARTNGSAPPRREAYPLDSPAANVGSFRGQPVDTWLDERPDGPTSLILPDGSFGYVWPDRDPTGNWFVDITFADGTAADSHAWDRGGAKAACERVLRAGSAAWRESDD